MFNKRITWIILSAVMFISAGVLIFYFLWANGFIDPPEVSPTTEYSEFTYPSLDPSQTITPDDVINRLDPEHKGTVDQDKNPVDFEKLQAVNPDIIGWIHMSSPFISQPILRSPNNDSFYLSHNASKKYDRAGSLFIEHKYNGADFEDMCTIIYGHRMSNGAMFGNLQASLKKVDLKSNSQYIVIYLPDKVKIYQICATIVRDKRHLMYYNDFDNESSYASFIDEVYHSKGKNVDLVESAKPKYGDKLLILSTCLRGDRTQRFLVIAKEIGNGSQT